MSVVDRWMATNSGIHSIRIDFTQTRTMRSIKMPIRQSGSLWLNYGSNQFRWQVGDPAQTIVTKFRGNLFIIRTQMKKYEKRAAGSGDVPPGLMAMATGFPRSTSEFQRKYSVQTIEVVGSAFRIVTQPKGQEGRGVKTFIFMVGRDDYRLRGMEIYLDDGSFVKTAFDRVIPNIGLPGDLFTPDLTGYKETKF
ncbi:MAG: outer membrane lipoprotein carrier protein LolA [Verrucomicrobiales bacterium]|nr:outer membrane lipoprotein carrier protein LolA [Verrucomicrobiales bacterium]